MNLGPESTPNEIGNLIDEQLEEDVIIHGDEGFYDDRETIPYEKEFDDGFGDTENMPSHVVLESEEDFKQIGNIYNVDINTLINKRNLAA